jgi:hypothetical protein
MDDADEPSAVDADLSTDLVEYFVVVVPELPAVAGVADALAELTRTGTIRLLDHAVVSRDAKGAVRIEDVEGTPAAESLDALAVRPGAWLSEHDLHLAAMALRAGTVGVVVVTEDRWAQPLSAAARRAGGQIVAGDRIPPRRVEALLAERDDET